MIYFYLRVQVADWIDERSFKLIRELLWWWYQLPDLKGVIHQLFLSWFKLAVSRRTWIMAKQKNTFIVFSVRCLIWTSSLMVLTYSSEADYYSFRKGPTSYRAVFRIQSMHAWHGNRSGAANCGRRSTRKVLIHVICIWARLVTCVNFSRISWFASIIYRPIVSNCLDFLKICLIWLPGPRVSLTVPIAVSATTSDSPKDDAYIAKMTVCAWKRWPQRKAIIHEMELM